MEKAEREFLMNQSSEIIKLRPTAASGPDEASFEPYLESYRLNDGKEHGAVVVLPGGGYSIRAPHEGTPVAETFRSFGMHAFVLQYRVSPFCYPAPQLDLYRALRIIRSHAEEWKVCPEKIAVLGFSAGGNLACSGAELYDLLEPEKIGDRADCFSGRPNAMILCYAVLTHTTGSEPLEKLEAGLPLGKLFGYDWRSLVTKETPPAFLWHTSEDDVVPVENALDYAEALRRNGIPFEAHIFPYGRHGLGLGTDPNVPELKEWPVLAGKWLIRNGWSTRGKKV